MAIIVPFQCIHPAPEYAAQVYEKANELLRSWLRHGVLEKEAERGYALYEQTMNKRTQTGPIFLTYRKNAVIQEITEHVKCSAPHFDFVAEDGIRHRGWSITDPEQIKAIQTAFAGIDRIYIADGHHRAASAVRVGLQRRREHPSYDGTEEFNYFLSVLFPDEELQILDYNRVIKDLNGRTPEELFAGSGKGI